MAFNRLALPDQELRAALSGSSTWRRLCLTPRADRRLSLPTGAEIASSNMSGPSAFGNARSCGQGASAAVVRPRPLPPKEGGAVAH